MNANDTKTLAAAATEIASYEHYEARVWQDKRVYITYHGKDLGYITTDDLDGGTGTCKRVQRSGDVSRILRQWQ